MNVGITLVVARVQLRLKLLEAYSEEFTEAKDAEAKSLLADAVKAFIEEKELEGEMPSDPLEFVRKELERLNKAFTDANQCLAAARTYGAELVHPKPRSLSAEILVAFPAKLQAFIDQTDEKLDAIRGAFPFEEWGIVEDVPPEIMWMAEQLSSYMPMHKMPRKDLFGFIRRTGPFYSEVDKRFAHVGELCGVIQQRREHQLHDLDTARAELDAGNHQAARLRLDKMDRIFSDVDYDTLLAECQGSTQPLEEAKQGFQELREDLLRPMKLGLAANFIPYLVTSAYRKRHAEVDGFLAGAQEFRQQTAASPESDIARDVEMFAHDLEKQCQALHGELEEARGRLAAKSWRHLSWLGMGFLICLVIGLSIAAVMWHRRKDDEAWARVMVSLEKVGTHYEKGVEECEGYVRGHSRGRHREEAEKMIKEVFPMKIIERERQVEQQRRQHEENDWQKANAAAKAADMQFERAIEAYQVYLRDHPHGVYLKEAVAQVEKALPAKIVDREWKRTEDEAGKASSAMAAWEGVEAFLKKFPGSVWNADALKLRDAAGSRVYLEIARKGQDSLRAGDWKQAYALFAQAIPYQPSDPLVLSLILKYKPYESAPGTMLGSFSTKSTVAALALGPGGKLVLIGHPDGSLGLWDLLEGREIRTLKGRISAAGAVAFSPDGKTALSGMEKTDMHLWDVASGAVAWALPDNAPRITHSEVMPDGKSVLCAMGKEPMMRLYDMANGKEMRVFSGSTDVVNSISVSADGRQVFSGGNDCFPRLWDFAKGKPVRIFKPHMRPITSVTLSGDGKTALSASKDGTVKIWNTTTGAEVGALPIRGDYVQCVALSPDARFALGANRDGTISFWDVMRKAELMVLKGHGDMVNCVAFSPDGSFAISGGRDGTFKLWSIWDAVRPPPGS